MGSRETQRDERDDATPDTIEPLGDVVDRVVVDMARERARRLARMHGERDVPDGWFPEW